MAETYMIYFRYFIKIKKKEKLHMYKHYITLHVLHTEVDIM